MSARWPARIALVAALTAPLLATTAPAEAVRRPSPICKTAMQQDRAYISKRPTMHPRRKARHCLTLRPVAVTWTAVAS